MLELDNLQSPQNIRTQKPLRLVWTSESERVFFPQSSSGTLTSWAWLSLFSSIGPFSGTLWISIIFPLGVYVLFIFICFYSQVLSLITLGAIRLSVPFLWKYEWKFTSSHLLGKQNPGKTTCKWLVWSFLPQPWSFHFQMNVFYLISIKSGNNWKKPSV